MLPNLHDVMQAPRPTPTSSPFETGEWCPSVPLSITPAFRLRVAQMGDGYQQKILDGINNLGRTIDVSYALRPQSLILAIDAFLKAQKAKAFLFKEPVSGEVITVWCEEWDITWDMVRFDPTTGLRTAWGTLDATFEEAYGVTV